MGLSWSNGAFRHRSNSLVMNTPSDQEPSSPGGQGGQEPERTAPGSMDAGLDRFAKAFEASARRWELVVYPSLFAFIVLAGYGFYLIYSLTHDVAIMARSIDKNMGQNMADIATSVLRLSDNVDKLRLDVHDMVSYTASLADNMTKVEGEMASMVVDVGKIGHNTQSISGDLTNISGTMHVLSANVGIISAQMEPIVGNMVAMSQFMSAMTFAIGRMGRDVGSMGQAARPMSMMNSFMPWGSGFMPW